MKTSDFIELLVADARPVRHLPRPLVRALLWMLLPAFVFGVLALSHGVRPRFEQQLADPGYLLGLASSLLTGLLAAVASFRLDIPGASRRWALLPVPTLLVWIASIGHGCLTPWVPIGPGAMRIDEAARCFATALLTSVPLSVAMFAMLRRGWPLSPTAVTFTGSLAVAAMSAAAVSVFHDLDASAMVLVWNLGTAACVVAIMSYFGRSLLAEKRSTYSG